MRGDEIRKIKEQIASLSNKLGSKVVEDLMIKSIKPGEITLTDPSNDEVPILQKADNEERIKILAKIEDDIKDDSDLTEKRGYSAKAAHAGHDIGKKGKNFSKIAASAGKKYGSKAAGERVAGAILANLRKESVQSDKDLMMEGMSMFINRELNEKLKPSMGVSAYIDDFVHSKNKRFADKSKEDRIKMAKGAYYGATKESAQLDERNADNKLKKDVFVAKKGIDAARKGLAANSFYNGPKQKSDRDGHDYRLASATHDDDWDDEAGQVHMSRKENVRHMKHMGRKAMANEQVVNEAPSYSPQADYDAGYRYYVIDRQTKKIIGKYKSGPTASRVVDKKDNDYGAYRYSRQPIELILKNISKDPTINEADDDNSQEDVVAVTVPLLLRMLEWSRESAGEDIQIHKLVDAMVEQFNGSDPLTSDDYETIISHITPDDPEIDDNGPEQEEESDYNG